MSARVLSLGCCSSVNTPQHPPRKENGAENNRRDVGYNYIHIRRLNVWRIIQQSKLIYFALGFASFIIQMGNITVTETRP